MSLLNEIQAKNRKPLSPEKLREIERQLSARQDIRLVRDQRSAVNLDAAVLAKYLKGIGSNWSNQGSIAERVLGMHIRASNPIPMVGSWGEGGKVAPDKHDRDYVSDLAEMAEQIKREYSPGVRIDLILADMHGVFNGFYPQGVRSKYLEQVSHNLGQAGIVFFWLSELYQKYGLALPNPHAPIDNRSEAYQVFAKHQDHYMESASSHHLVNPSAAFAAYNYVAMRLREREMLADAFPNFFLLVNGNKMTSEPLLPRQMPILYLRWGPVWFRREHR